MDRREIALRASRAASKAAAERRYARYIEELREAGYLVVRTEEKDETQAVAVNS